MPPRASTSELPRRSPRAAPLVDADGFRLIVSKRRLRSEQLRRRPRPAWRPVPADLVGRCFNYLAFDHVAARCSFPSRCLRCDEVGHTAKNCKRRRPAAPHPWRRGRPVRRVGACRDAADALWATHVGHSAASASTSVAFSRSTGRPYSGPPSVCAPSPTAHWSPPPPVHPRGHPSRRPAMAFHTVSHSAELQAEAAGSLPLPLRFGRLPQRRSSSVTLGSGGPASPPSQSGWLEPAESHTPAPSAGPEQRDFDPHGR